MEGAPTPSTGSALGVALFMKASVLGLEQERFLTLKRVIERCGQRGLVLQLGALGPPNSCSRRWRRWGNLRVAAIAIFPLVPGERSSSDIDDPAAHRPKLHSAGLACSYAR